MKKTIKFYALAIRRTKHTLLCSVLYAGTAFFLFGCTEDESMMPSNDEEQVLLEGFNSSESDKEWQVKNFSMSVLSSASDFKAPLAEGAFWQSPRIQIEPMSFFRIEVQSQGGQSTWIGGMGFNKDATWGRYPHAGATDGELVADDWTSWPNTTENSWTKRVFFTRALRNSTASGVRLMGAGAVFKDLRVTKATFDETIAWVDQVYSEEMSPLSWLPADDVARACPRAKNLLKSGQPLKIAFVGDSIMNDMANSPIDVLLAQNYPKSSVEIINAVGGGTGAGAWLNDHTTSWPSHDLNLDAAVIQTRPDLVLIGGISNGSSWRSDISALVSRIRTESKTLTGASPEILLVSGAFGEAQGNTDEEMAKLASELKCDFLPLRSITEDYFKQSLVQSYPRNHFYRDGLHANHRGKQLMARILLAFFQ